MSTAYDPDQPPGERGARAGEPGPYGDETARYDVPPGQEQYAGAGRTETQGTMLRTETAEDIEFRHWWQRFALVLGAVSIVLGFILVIWPGETLVVAAVLIGLWLLIAGVIKLAQAAFIPEGRGGGARVLQAIGGVLLILVGVLAMRNVFTTVGLLAAIVGVSWLVIGVIQLFSAFSNRFHGWYRLGELAFGALTVLAGLVVLLWPAISLTAIVWVSGLWLIVIGISQLVVGWRARKPSESTRGYGRPAVA